MATTNIELDIENITGIGSGNADAQFIKTAQKFVVSSIPKNLMLWAGTTTAVGSHGGDSSPTAITLPQPTDNILDVQRNGFSAEQVPESMQGFIANTSSLYLATETYPKYYIQAGNKVIVKPDPSDSETALVNYVDFLKIDDDCDLRNAVIFHAASKEFTKIATDKTIDYTDQVVPVSPTLQDNSISFSTSVPTFTPPVMSVPDFVDTNTWISTEEDSEMLSARVQEIQTKVGEYSARMAEAQAVFNKENAEYQAQLQISIQNAQLSSQDDGQKLQDYSSKVQTYSSEVNEQIQKIGTAVQNMSYYSNESKKYYEWARMEVQQYVQNNSKMIQAGAAMQAASQQQQSRR